MNALDVALIALVVLASVRGYRRGALSMLGAFGGSLGGLVVGAAFAPDVAGFFVSEPGFGLALLTLAVVLVCLSLGQALGLALGHRLRAVVAGAGAAPADRGAGIAVGAAGVLAAVWLLAGVLAQGPWPVVAQQLQGSTIASGVAEALPRPPDVMSRVGDYLDREGFPQAFAGLGGPVAPPVDPPSEGAVAAAADSGVPSTVRVNAGGCDAMSLGSGFVTADGYVVTNAHVVAGADRIMVHDQVGGHAAEPIHMDPQVDVAVLRVPELTAPPIPWASEQVARGAAGATLGFPGGSATMEVRPAAVRARTSAVGHDIYGSGSVNRDILVVSAAVVRGESGGPFVTADGTVGGVVFAASRSEDGTGYALTAASVREQVGAAIARDAVVDTGPCRF